MKNRIFPTLLPALFAAFLGIAIAGSPSQPADENIIPPAGKPVGNEDPVAPWIKGRASTQGILAKLKNPANRNAAAVITAMDRRDLEVGRNFALVPGLQRLVPKPGPAARNLDENSIMETIKELQKTGLYEYVEPDWIVQAQAMPSDAALSDGSLWGLRNTGQSGGVPGADINALDAWRITTGSAATIVAVIDTGIRHTHQDLAANMWLNPGESGGGRETNGLDDDGNGYIDDVHGINSITGSGDPMDDNSHGSHCAGTIGAVANGGGPHVGVAWNVRLMGLKFLAADGYGSTGNAITCIDYAVANGARVLSNSWGGGGFSQALYDSISAAKNAGVLFIAAAGNKASNADVSPDYPAGYDLDNIVSVAALDRFDQLAGFSNYGATTVDLGAPGVDIYSCTAGSDTSYAYYNGTSMATPHVAGVAALLAAAHPAASWLELKQRLMAGRPVASMAGKSVSGTALNAEVSLMLANGSFEHGLDAWLAEGNLSPAAGGGITATDGSRFVAFNNGQRPPNGVLTQNIATIPGEPYTLDFDVGVFAYNTLNQRLRVTVESGGVTLVDNITTVTGGGAGSTRWTSRNFQFTPTSNLTVLRFYDVSTTTDSLDLLLDNVRIAGPRRWTLTVITNGSDVTNVAASPADIHGRAGGATSFQREYFDGQTVVLTADPTSASGLTFSTWFRNFEFDNIHTTTSVVMTEDITMFAEYRPFSPPVITSPSSAEAIQGLSFDYEITAYGGVSFYSTSALPPGLSLQNNVITGVPTSAGQFNIVLSATNAIGTGTATLTLTVAPEPGDHLTESFAASNDTGGCSFTFIPDGSPNHYRVKKRSVTSFPTDPADGQVLSLADDSFAQVDFQYGMSFPFFGSEMTGCYVNSNGNVTFGSGDTSYTENLDRHFSKPRIAALFDDLNPNAGGSVSWKQSANRMTITYQGVPEFSADGANNLQIEMFFDGRIRITVLSIAASDGLIGLSRGMGVPLHFAPSDFSSYPPDIALSFMSDDFDPGYDALLWEVFGGTVTANTAGQAAGPGSSGNSLHFDGFGSRHVLSSPVDLRGGGSISFLFALADGDGSPWEFADFGEEVVLEYTVDEGASFVQFGGPFSNRIWQTYNFPIPAGARTAATQFRWRQLNHSGAGFDNWALDDVIVSNVPAGPEIAVEQPTGNILTDGSSSVSAITSIGGSADLAFNVRNDGGSDLTGLAISITGSHAADYSVITQPAADLAPLDSTTFTVRFSPSAQGARSAVLHVASNDADENPFDVNLVGTGVSAQSAVSVFENGAYVDLSGEVVHTRAALTSLGYQVSGFTGVEAADWNAAFSAGVVVIPELENAELILSVAALNAINAHLAAGKGLVLMGSPSALQFLNSLRGWALVYSGYHNDGLLMSKVPGLTGFTGSPLQLAGLNATYLAADSSLPAGAVPVYQTASGTAVFVAGPVAYLGYDWYDGVDIGWTQVLNDAMAVVNSPPAVPEIAVEQPAGNGLTDNAATLACGSANVGSSTAPLSVTIRNTGSAALTGLAVTKSGSHAGDFTVGAPGSSTLAPGDSTTFTVTMTPSAAGSRTAALQIASNDADENPFDIALNGTGVVGPAINVVHSAPSYRPSANMVMTVELDYAGQTLSALGYSLQLPSGWTYVSDTSSAGVKPIAGETGTIEWAWLTVPVDSASFTVTLLAPSSASGNQNFSALATLADTQGVQTQVQAEPNPLSVPLTLFHTVDVDSDSRYELTELLSVISLYNYRDGTTRTGEFYRDGNTYRPGTGTRTPPYHSTDLDESWRISLTELLSDISLYNYREGTVRTGQYHYNATSGRFMPGPASPGAAVNAAAAIASVDLDASLSNLSGPLSDAGGVASLQVSLSFNGTQTTSLGVEFTLPAGWSMISETSGAALVKPDPGQTGELGWAWSNIPSSPVQFTVMVNYPPATAPGVLTGRAIAGDPAGSQTQDALILEMGLDPYAIWVDGAFAGAPEGVDASFNGDPDSDGSNNLLEYALGTNPLSGAGVRPTLAFNSSGYPRLSLAKGSIAGLDPRIRYAVEASTDLENWSEVGVVIIENSATTITADYTLPAESVLLRLSVTMDP